MDLIFLLVSVVDSLLLYISEPTLKLPILSHQNDLSHLNNVHNDDNKFFFCIVLKNLFTSRGICHLYKYYWLGKVRNSLGPLVEYCIFHI